MGPMRARMAQAARVHGPLLGTLDCPSQAVFGPTVPGRLQTLVEQDAMAEEAPAAAEPASESSEAPKAVPVQKSGGGFKLRLKLHSQPPAPVKPASTTEEEEDDEDEDEEEDEEESDDEEEDQLASSSSDSEDQADRASSLSALSSRPNASSLAHPSPSRSLLGTARAPRVQYNEDYHFDDDDDDGSRLSSVPPSDDGQPSQDPSLLAAPNPDAVEDAPEGTSDIDPIERHPATTSTVDPAPGPALASTSTKPVTLAKKRKKAVGTGRGKGWRAGITGTGAAAQMPNPSADGLLPPPAKKSRKGKKCADALHSTRRPALMLSVPRGGRGSAAHNAGTSQFAFEDASLALYVPPPPIPRIAHDPSLGPPVPPPVTGVRPFPLGPLPKAQSGFLPAQTLEKKAPRTRAWKKVLREVVTVGGYPCRMWTFAGGPSPSPLFAGRFPRPLTVENV